MEERITRPLKDVSLNRSSYMHGADYYFDVKLCAALVGSFQHFFAAGTQRVVSEPNEKKVKRVDLKGSSNFDTMVFFTLDNNLSYPLTDAYLAGLLRSKPHNPVELADSK